MKGAMSTQQFMYNTSFFFLLDLVTSLMLIAILLKLSYRPGALKTGHVPLPPITEASHNPTAHQPVQS
jgi:hypothetical protein